MSSAAKRSALFPPLQLSREEEHELEQLTQQILTQHLHEYEHFVRMQRRQMSKNKWKPLRTRDLLTVYQKLGADETDTTTAPPPSSASAPSVISMSVTDTSSSTGTAEALSDAGSTKLALVGSLVGSLEDALYGAFAPTTTSMKINSGYLEEELVDWHVIAEITRPTRAQPLQYLALKCTMTATPRASVATRPRVYVFVEAMGIHVAANGDRFGYQIVHSVDLSRYETGANHLDSVRAKRSACFLLRQSQTNTVDVYARTWCDAVGKALEKVATQNLTSTGKWVWCAQHKKLAWLVSVARAEKRRESPGETASSSSSSSSLSSSSCVVCSRNASMFRSLTTCALCENPVCGKCRTTRKLSFLTQTGAVDAVALDFCTPCITKASMTPTVDVIVNEFVVPNDGEPQQRAPSSTSTATSIASRNRSLNGSVEDGRLGYAPPTPQPAAYRTRTEHAQSIADSDNSSYSVHSQMSQPREYSQPSPRQHAPPDRSHPHPGHPSLPIKPSEYIQPPSRQYAPRDRYQPQPQPHPHHPSLPIQPSEYIEPPPRQYAPRDRCQPQPHPDHPSLPIQPSEYIQPPPRQYAPRDRYQAQSRPDHPSEYIQPPPRQYATPDRTHPHPGHPTQPTHHSDYIQQPPPRQYAPATPYHSHLGHYDRPSEFIPQQRCQYEPSGPYHTHSAHLETMPPNPYSYRDNRHTPERSRGQDYTDQSYHSAQSAPNDSYSRPPHDSHFASRSLHMSDLKEQLPSIGVCSRQARPPPYSRADGRRYDVDPSPLHHQQHVRSAPPPTHGYPPHRVQPPPPQGMPERPMHYKQASHDSEWTGQLGPAYYSN